MTDPSPSSNDADGWAAPAGPTPTEPSTSAQPPYGQPPYGQPPHGQPPFGQAPYGPTPYGSGAYPVSQGWGYGTVPPHTEGLATAALVVSLVGVVLSFGCGIGMLLEIAALPMSIVARRRIRDANGALTGDGQALAALIISSVVLALALLLIIIVVAVNVAGSGSNP